MKKIFSMALMFVAAITAMTSCSSDNDDNPTLQSPTSFVLNTPALAEQYIQLSADNGVRLTWSQPDYGYNALASYQVQVGLKDGDNITWNVETSDDGEGNTVTTPKFLDTEYTNCAVDLNGEEIAQHICALDGVEEEDQYVDMGAREIAFRVRSVIKSSDNSIVPGTEIFSNPVVYKHLASYCAIKSKAYIYLVGQPEGWSGPAADNAAHYEDWRIYETEVGSQIFKGSLYIPAGQFQLRFYTALTGWDGGASIGAQEADEKVNIELDENDEYKGDIVAPGKGSWEIADFPGGYVTFTIDMIQKKVTYKYTGDHAEEMPTGAIYLIGDCGGWKEPAEENAADLDAWKLYSYPSTGESIYYGTFNIPAGKFTFRFYTALTGWNGGASVGIQEVDEAMGIDFSTGLYEGAVVAPGKGSWQYNDWAGGKVKMVVNLVDNTVSFTKM